LTIAPTLNVRWMTASVFAERYLYLPSVGFSWLIAGGLVWMWNRTEVRGRSLRWGMAAAVATLAALSSYAIVKRNREWRSDLDLVTGSLAAQPESAHMHAEYGMFKWNAGEHDAAEREWQLALHYNPDSAEALADLGFARLEEKKYDEATAFLQRTIELKPRFAAPHIHLGRVYAAEGKNEQAETELLRGLEIHPTNTQGLNALGEFYLQQGRLAEAAEQFRRSVEIYSDVRAWSSLGEIYDQENDPEKARGAWQQVLTFESFNPHAHRSLGQIYLSHEQWALAQNEFQLCLLMDQKDSVALSGLEKIRSATGAAENKK